MCCFDVLLCNYATQTGICESDSLLVALVLVIWLTCLCLRTLSDDSARCLYSGLRFSYLHAMTQLPDDSSFQRHFTGAPWEPKVGYCRALRAGNLVYVSGTAPVDDTGKTFAPGDAYAQARRCFEIARSALAELGAGMHQVVRSRMYVPDISRWAEYGKAHQEFFGEHPPVATMVEVKGLIDPDMLIEVEIEAMLAPLATD